MIVSKFLPAMLVLLAPLFQEASVDAEILLFRGEYAAAAACFERMIQENPADDSARAGRIRALLKQEKLAEARTAAEDALNDHPSSPGVLTASGDLLMRSGMPELAVTRYAQALTLDPGFARACLGMNRCHWFNFNRRSAKRMLEKAYSQDPADPEIMVNYARGCPAQKKIALLSRALALSYSEAGYTRQDIAEHIKFLQLLGERRTWRLPGEPRPAVLKLERVGRIYLVKAKINRTRDLTLLLDSGASGLNISRKTASRLKLGSFGSSSIAGLGDKGKQPGQYALVDTLEFGSLTFSDCIVHVHREHNGAYDGMLGIDVFQQFLIGLDLIDNRIDLQPLPPVDGRRMDDPSDWEDLDRTAIPELSGFLPFYRMGHLILLETRLNGHKAGYFALDTGAMGNIVSLEAGEPFLNLFPAEKPIRGVSGVVRKTMNARAVLLQIGPYRQMNQLIPLCSFGELNRSMGFELSGLLGITLLDQFKVIIDFRDGLVKYRHRGQ